MAHKKGNQEEKEQFKQIFRDGWKAFKEQYPRYEAVEEVVGKMLGCGEAGNGYAEYVCPECLWSKQVAFSCKSSFCMSCAKTYTANWVETVQGMLHEGVKYRHLVLTVPEALRVWFYRYPERLYDGLLKIAAPMMDDAVSVAKGQKVELGYIVVLQTAGRAANYNPHLHIIMTGGGLDEGEQWQELKYIRYEIIHKKWQYYLLGMVKEALSDQAEVEELIDELWRRYPKGLVAHLKEKAVPKVDKLAHYVAKYVVSPPIALSRIISYDREEGIVRYWYEDHRAGRQEVELSRSRFIGRLVQHILPKGFKRIRYYGLQATCKVKKVATILKKVFRKAVQGVMDFVAITPLSAVVKLTYQTRLKRAYGQDPLCCKQCGAQLWLWRIWHPKYGVIYDEAEAIKTGKYEPPPEPELPVTATEPEPVVSQLSLFDLQPPLVYA